VQTRFWCLQRAIGRIDGSLRGLSQLADVFPNCLHAAADAAVQLQPVSFSGFTGILRYRRCLLPLLQQSQQSEPEIEFAAGNARVARKKSVDFNARDFICASYLRECVLQALSISGNAQRPRQGQERL
jgi:hypothetical protein